MRRRVTGAPQPPLTSVAVRPLSLDVASLRQTVCTPPSPQVSSDTRAGRERGRVLTIHGIPTCNHPSITPSNPSLSPYLTTRAKTFPFPRHEQAPKALNLQKQSKTPRPNPQQIEAQGISATKTEERYCPRSPGIRLKRLTWTTDQILTPTKRRR